MRHYTSLPPLKAEGWLTLVSLVFPQLPGGAVFSFFGTRVPLQAQLTLKGPQVGSFDPFFEEGSPTLSTGPSFNCILPTPPKNVSEAFGVPSRPLGCIFLPWPGHLSCLGPCVWCPFRDLPQGDEEAARYAEKGTKAGGVLLAKCQRWGTLSHALRCYIYIYIYYFLKDPMHVTVFV